MENLPIVIVAPTKRLAYHAAVRIGLSADRDLILIGNRSHKKLEGLKATRFRTFFIMPDAVDYSIMCHLEVLFARAEFEARTNNLKI